MDTDEHMDENQKEAEDEKVNSAPLTFYLENLGLAEYQDYILSICDDKYEDEYYLLSTNGDCRDAFRCNRTETSRLEFVTCPIGLVFDLERETCDIRTQVNNCNLLSMLSRGKPNLPTLEPLCPLLDIQCY